MPYSATSADHDELAAPSKWIFVGASTFAGIAGFVNTCLLSFFYIPVSHMTGAAARISIDLAAMDLSDLRLILSIMAAFFGGAVLSGAIIGKRRLTTGRHYGVTLMIEGLLLVIATALLVNGMRIGVTVAAMACGVQNAMVSSYRGLVIRTTHVTGVITDIGVMIGHLIRDRHVPTWKFLFMSSIVGGFIFGAFLGAVLLNWVGLGALILPAILCFIAGSWYYLWIKSN